MAKIFLASLMDALDIELYKSMGGKHILASYAMLPSRMHNKQITLSDMYGDDIEIFLDSGAFSAYNSGKPINIDDYMAFVDFHKPKLYANLDVIGDWKGTVKNQEYLEKHGLRPMPVFHARDPPDLLPEYVKKYEYIGLGGRSTLSNAEFVEFLRTVIHKYPKTKFHCFGCNDRDFVLFEDYFSVDATTWNIGSIKGEIPDLSELAGRVYVGSKGIDKVRRDHLYNYNRNQLVKAFYFMELAGIDSKAIYADDDLEKKRAWFKVLVTIEKLHEKHPDLYTAKEQSSLDSFKTLI